jgi:Rieske Fe-S protein
VSSSPEHPRPSGSSRWPIGIAAGVVVVIVGLWLPWEVVLLGGIIAAAFTALWVRDAAKQRELTAVPDIAPEVREAELVPGPGPDTSAEVKTYKRSAFLEISTIGVGGAVGVLINVPIIGFMIGPAFLKQGVPDVDLGPVSQFPPGRFMITTFTSQPAEGDVSRRTAFVRYNGLLVGHPSFTIISNHCAHLGCPVQANGPPIGRQMEYKDVVLQGNITSGFGCPCHGGQYDTEGNRTAGPPVRSLDRYSFSIKAGHLYVGAPFSVAKVVGTGAEAQIYKVDYAFPGEHVDGLEKWLYPIQPPHS